MKQPHIQLSEEQAARYAVLPGDPGRVGRAAEFLTDVREMAFNREYRSISGFYNGVKILVMSTGMGGASTGIGVEELRSIGVEYMIRIGSCGVLQRGIGIGDLVLANGAVRDDGTSKAYIESVYPAVPDTELLMSVMQAAGQSNFPYHVGIIRSHDSFYTDEEEEIDRYWSKRGVLAADMETAALFTVGTLRGVKTASILNNVAAYEADLKDELSSYVDETGLAMTGEEREILTAFKACEIIERKHEKARTA